MFFILVLFKLFFFKKLIGRLTATILYVTLIQDVSKKCPKYKIASKLDLCKITDGNSNQRPTANIGVHLRQFCFHMFDFVSSGSSRCLIFKWLAHKNFKLKMIFCALPEKMIRSKYRRATPPTIELITYFFLLYLQHGHHDVKCKPSIYYILFFLNFLQINNAIPYLLAVQK